MAMRTLATAAWVLACGCGPNVKAPVAIMALLYDNANKLGPKQTELTTVTNVTGLKGSVVNLVGGGAIAVDPSDPIQGNLAGMSDQQVADAFIRARGTEVHANLIDRSGVLWPGDFHSWAMVTTYWNFEQAFIYFNRIYDGEKTDTLAGADVLYWGDYRDYGIVDPSLQSLTDNVVYFPPTRQFLVAPFNQVQKVPVSMNLGIVGHEFSHRVFTQKAYGNQPLIAELSWNNSAHSILRALDEGLADFHGYGVTCLAKDGPGCKTKFLLASFDDTIATKRDFSRSAENCMSRELLTALLSLDPNTFVAQGKQYELGTLIAAALYQAANRAGRLEVMQKALIRAYSDESNLTPGFRQIFQANINTPQNVTLEAVSDVILSHITDPELKRLACNELWDRLNLNPAERPLPHCPPTSARGSTCSPITP